MELVSLRGLGQIHRENFDLILELVPDVVSRRRYLRMLSRSPDLPQIHVLVVLRKKRTIILSIGMYSAGTTEISPAPEFIVCLDLVEEYARVISLEDAETDHVEGAMKLDLDEEFNRWLKRLCTFNYSPLRLRMNS